MISSLIVLCPGSKRAICGLVSVLRGWFPANIAGRVETWAQNQVVKSLATPFFHDLLKERDRAVFHVYCRSL